MILAALFILGEMFTSGFVLLWFGIGSIVAALLGLLGLGLPLQIVAFLAVSVALTVASRTIFDRFIMRGSPGRELKMGMDMLPGKVGIVVNSSEGAMSEGAVRVFGSTWRAFPAEGEEPLREGEQVQVERVDGATVYVRRVGQEPSWRRDYRNSVNN